MKQTVMLLLVWVVLTSYQVPISSPYLALVIGNSQYQHLPLSSPVNDAQGVGNYLYRLGLDTMVRTDLNYQAFSKVVSEWINRVRLERKKPVFYFSGHGVQFENESSMRLLGTDGDTKDLAKKRSITTDAILQQLQAAGCSERLLILDACRDDPNTKALQSKSVHIESIRQGAQAHTLMAYAASPSQRASAGLGLYSPYTQAFLAALDVKGFTTQTIFNRLNEFLKNSGQDPQCEGCDDAQNRVCEWVLNTGQYRNLQVAPVAPHSVNINGRDWGKQGGLLGVIGLFGALWLLGWYRRRNTKISYLDLYHNGERLFLARDFEHAILVWGQAKKATDCPSYHDLDRKIKEAAEIIEEEKQKAEKKQVQEQARLKAEAAQQEAERMRLEAEEAAKVNWVAFFARPRNKWIALKWHFFNSKQLKFFSDSLTQNQQKIYSLGIFVQCILPISALLLILRAAIMAYFDLPLAWLDTDMTHQWHQLTHFFDKFFFILYLKQNLILLLPLLTTLMGTMNFPIKFVILRIFIHLLPLALVAFIAIQYLHIPTFINPQLINDWNGLTSFNDKLGLIGKYYSRRELIWLLPLLIYFWIIIQLRWGRDLGTHIRVFLNQVIRMQFALALFPIIQTLALLQPENWLALFVLRLLTFVVIVERYDDLKAGVMMIIGKAALQLELLLLYSSACHGSIKEAWYCPYFNSIFILCLIIPFFELNFRRINNLFQWLKSQFVEVSFTRNPYLNDENAPSLQRVDSQLIALARRSPIRALHFTNFLGDHRPLKKTLIKHIRKEANSVITPEEKAIQEAKRVEQVREKEKQRYA